MKVVIIDPEKTSIARQHVLAETNMHTSVDELLDTVFVIWYVPLYKDDQ